MGTLTVRQQEFLERNTEFVFLSMLQDGDALVQNDIDTYVLLKDARCQSVEYHFFTYHLSV